MLVATYILSKYTVGNDNLGNESEIRTKFWELKCSIIVKMAPYSGFDIFFKNEWFNNISVINLSGNGLEHFHWFCVCEFNLIARKKYYFLSELEYYQ